MQRVEFALCQSMSDWKCTKTSLFREEGKVRALGTALPVDLFQVLDVETNEIISRCVTRCLPPVQEAQVMDREGVVRYLSLLSDAKSTFFRVWVGGLGQDSHQYHLKGEAASIGHFRLFDTSKERLILAWSPSDFFFLSLESMKPIRWMFWGSRLPSIVGAELCDDQGQARLLVWSDARFGIWNLNDGDCLYQFPITLKFRIEGAALFRLADQLRVLAWSNGALRIFNPHNGEVEELRGEGGAILGAQPFLDPEGRVRILSWSRRKESQVQIWNPETRQCLASFQPCSGHSTGTETWANIVPAFEGEGIRFMTWSRSENKLHLWQAVFSEDPTSSSRRRLSSTTAAAVLMIGFVLAGALVWKTGVLTNYNNTISWK
jgi:hypothetical protein